MPKTKAPPCSQTITGREDRLAGLDGTNTFRTRQSWPGGGGGGHLVLVGLAGDLDTALGRIGVTLEDLMTCGGEDKE